VETNLWQYYKTNYPGQVQVLGCDVRDGTIAQLNGFRTTTGVTYPLLRNCFGTVIDPQNFVNWYGDRDGFVVINKKGIVRYRAQQFWPYGNGYHLSEIRGCVDSLVTFGLGADGSPPARIAFSASPNPAHGQTTVSLALPRDEASLRVEVLDLSGRLVDRLHQGPTSAGTHEWIWDLAQANGRVAPGVYLLHAQGGTWQRTARVVVVR
jgi:hypothetical protein